MCCGTALHPACQEARSNPRIDTFSGPRSCSIPGCQGCPSAAGTEQSGEKVTGLEPLHCHEEVGSWSQSDVGHGPEPGHSTSVTGTAGQMPSDGGGMWPPREKLESRFHWLQSFFKTSFCRFVFSNRHLQSCGTGLC